MAIATQISNLGSVLVLLYFVKKQIPISFKRKSNALYLLASLIMFTIVKTLESFLSIGAITTVIQIITGFVSYALIMIIFNSNYMEKTKEMLIN